MKKKYMAAAFGLSLVLAFSTGCGNTSAADTAAETAATEDAADEETKEVTEENPGETDEISGEITALGDNTITVNEQEITVTDSTEITKMGGGMGNAPGGDGSGKPDGNAPDGKGPGKSDGNAPGGDGSGKPDGNAPDGEAPEKPDGNAPGGDGSGKPDGNAPGGEAPEKPDGSKSDAGSTSDSAAPADNGNTPPDKPDGDENPPEKPDGDGSDSGKGGQPQGDAPDGQMPGGETIEFSDLAVGDQVRITLAEDGTAAAVTVMDGNMPMGGGPGGGGSSAPTDYTAVYTYSEDTSVDGDTIESTGTDENAIHVSGGETSVTGATIKRTSEDSTGGDNSSFYGVGAALLATSGTLNIEDSTITTDAAGGAGVFAYGNSTVNVSDTAITTQQDTSGGIHVAGGGTLTAENLDVTTYGESSAAIRSDRGGGTMTVNEGSYVSNGTGSPAVYCTADITVSDADLIANGSEAVCIEGFNTLRLKDSDLTGNMSDNEQNDCTWNVIVYQSMSGDSEEGNGTFEMDGGTLTTKNGGIFYTTNTESTITLRNVDLVCSEEPDFFLQCTGNTNKRGWGTAGANGADCLFTGINQKMQGDVIWDSISQLDFYITEGSELTGAVLNDETYAGSGGDGYCNIILDEDSTWIVTGDSSLTSLSSMGTIKDADGKSVTIKGTDGMVYVQGDSEYTITVSSYSTEVDLSGESVITE